MGDFCMKENSNIIFLNTIYQICEMGVIGINDVIDKISKIEFRNILEKIKKEYNTIIDESEVLFSSYGAKEKELGPIVKINSKLLSEIKLVKNKEDSKIARMVIEGIGTGIDNLEHARNIYNEEDKEIDNLATKLLSILKNNIKERTKERQE